MGPSRRAVLAAALALPGAATLSACSSSAPSPTAPDPLELALRAARQRERRLLALHAAVGRAHPELADRISAVREHHREHLTALSPPPAPVGASSPAGSTSPSPAPSPSPLPSPAPPVPGDPAAALAALAAAEDDAAAEGARACASARAGDLAVLLGRVAVAESAHAVLLREGAGAP